MQVAQATAPVPQVKAFDSTRGFEKTLRKGQSNGSQPFHLSMENEPYQLSTASLSTTPSIHAPHRMANRQSPEFGGGQIMYVAPRQMQQPMGTKRSRPNELELDTGD